MKFIDSNPMVYAFTNHELSDKCQKILKKQLLTNTLVLVELHAKISTIVDSKHADKSVKSVLQSNNIKIIELDQTLLFEAIKRRKKYKLKISDLIHYVTALIHECDSIYSYDKDFDDLELERVEP